MGGRLHLYLQRCGSPRRLLLRCPPLGSPAAALLLPGFCPPRTEAQTVSVRKGNDHAHHASFFFFFRPRFSGQEKKASVKLMVLSKLLIQIIYFSVSHRVFARSFNLFLPFLDHSEVCEEETVWPAVMSWNRTDSQTAKLSPHLDASSLLSNRVQMWL